MQNSKDILESVITPPAKDLGDGFTVRRAVPTPQRRMVGPFVFIDQMGPHRFAAGTGLDVRPHPHIGLATLTFLFDGEIMHRDSLGTVMAIRPGAVNWMTAGRGIVHSERTAPERRHDGSNLFGLQCWVALPQAHEEDAPSFLHLAADAMPQIETEGLHASVVAGTFMGHTSPLPTLSPLFFVDVRMEPDATLTVATDYQERALFLVEGSLDMGQEGRFEAGQLLVLRQGHDATIRAAEKTRLVLLGGDKLDGPRALIWNFVSSSLERLEQARADWAAGRFAAVPGDTTSIPQPEAVGKPVLYP